ncbi:protein S100-Z [Synchiropus splendidus]|uniref:protein S100-Z n=1 Tax=Synchiropus splendidus TaxID=270530 RepID=UPI00237D6DFA|nr:protein S100-Z [Synchiropus splendidus]
MKTFPWRSSPEELIIHSPLERQPLSCCTLPNKQAAVPRPSSHSDWTVSRIARMPSQLEGAMDALITVFYNYSGNDGDKYKLNKGELKQLLNSELTDFLTSQKDPMLVEKIMNDLDSNKDNEVDFNEFVVLVAALTVACNDFFQEQKKKAK